MITLRTNLIALFAAALCLFPLFAGGQESNSVPGMAVSSRIIKVQEQADEVYERTDYERAFFIYRHELAPIGDKYAQYMVGYMYLSGKGVDEDAVAAAAWYRLAAERGTKEFIQASDRLRKQLDSAQAASSDEQFLRLRKDFGDLALIMRELRKDYELLQDRTGTRLGSGTSPMLIVGADGRTQSGTSYYGEVEKRIEARLEYISRTTRIEIIDISPDSVDLETLEAEVSAHLNELD